MKPNEKQIRWLARSFSKNVIILEVIPRAYCVAKPAPGCAVFSTPWRDYRKHLVKSENKLYNSSVTITEISASDSVFNVQLGDWRTLVYGVAANSATWYVVDKLMPFTTFEKDKNR